ncbi:MAG TPA: hypothetical protein VN461_03890 [Vicinamibacteria bacterium]|jgi:hypothetical protein|nr:hypothetical protein [Vicinamibacteria bacterium]
MKHLPTVLAAALAFVPGWRTESTERAQDGAPTAPPRTLATGTFSGQYKLTLTASPSCTMTVPSVTVLVDLSESPVRQPASIADPIAQGSEVFGQGTAGDSTVGRFVLLRQGDQLHGGFGTKDFGIRTLEGLRVWVRLAGTANATATTLGRPQAQGTAIGDIEMSRPRDDAPDTLGACLGGRDHTWSLQPQ